MIIGVNGVGCSSYDGVINCIRASPKTIELTMLRKHVAVLVQSKMHMQAENSRDSRDKWPRYVAVLVQSKMHMQAGNSRDSRDKWPRYAPKAREDTPYFSKRFVAGGREATSYFSKPFIAGGRAAAVGGVHVHTLLQPRARL